MNQRETYLLSAISGNTHIGYAISAVSHIITSTGITTGSITGTCTITTTSTIIITPGRG